MQVLGRGGRVLRLQRDDGEPQHGSGGARGGGRALIGEVQVSARLVPGEIDDDVCRPQQLPIIAGVDLRDELQVVRGFDCRAFRADCSASLSRSRSSFNSEI